MVYIFEGVDNVGKGTQIQKLKRHLEEKGELVHILHYSNIKGDNIEERSKQYYYEMFNLIKFATFNKINLILDRAHGGETVYSPIYRNYSGDYIYDIEQNFGNRILQNITLFVFTDDPENLIDREDGQSFSTEFEKKRDEIVKFIDFFEKSKIKNKALINIQDMDIEQVFNKMKEFIEAK